MEAKQRRQTHFKSSVGSMLNENYGYGYTQNTVQTGDFVHLPPTHLPTCEKALEFLHTKLLPPTKPPRGIGSSNNNNTTSSELYQAYRNVTGQPVGMVHYDRDPFYWPGKDRPPSENGSVQKNAFNCFDYMFNEGRGYNLPTPDDMTSRKSAVSTPSTLKSKRTSSVIISSGKERKFSGHIHNLEGDDQAKQINSRTSSSLGIPHEVRFGVLADDKLLDKNGFKAYSPFADTSPDFDVKLGKKIQNHVKQPEEKDRTTPITAPKYSDALNKVLDLSPEEINRIPQHNKSRRPADILKLHGNPEYPSKVMKDKDIPNYVAWAKIYPYCPLTQKEGDEMPRFVPPRGFTPSTPASSRPQPSTQAKLRDLKKTKRNIMEGINLLSGSSSRKRKEQQQKQQHVSKNNKSILKNANSVNQEGKSNIDAMKQSLLDRSEIQKNDSGVRDKININTTRDKANATALINIAEKFLRDNEDSPTLHAYNSIMQQMPDASRKGFELRTQSKNGDAFYSGKTPTRTPTPDSRIPVKADRAWIKHYSPARIQRFMETVAKPNSQI